MITGYKSDSRLGLSIQRKSTVKRNQRKFDLIKE